MNIKEVLQQKSGGKANVNLTLDKSLLKELFDFKLKNDIRSLSPMVNEMLWSAPFNMALATLQRVDNILQKIMECSIMMADPYLSIFLKIKLTKQLYLASVPLITNKETKEELLKKVNDLNKLISTNYSNVKKKNIQVYQSNSELVIENVIEDIEEALQADKYFMPPKSDPKFGWKES
jgi:hypothetical protein